MDCGEVFDTVIPFVKFLRIELRLPVAHFRRLATDALGFCHQSAHYTQQFPSLLWACGGL